MENLRELASTAVRKPVQWREFSQKHGKNAAKESRHRVFPDERHVVNVNWRKKRRVKYALLYNRADIHGMNSQKPRQKPPKPLPCTDLFIGAGEASRCQPSGRDEHSQKHGKNAVSTCPTVANQPKTQRQPRAHSRIVRSIMRDVFNNGCVTNDEALITAFERQF
ncbi:MAG: hypothetical protein FWD57_15850, partial [Polyangiaceae bacterium]|nr:hypothetical protein [Polyangiaceae bacterium]